MSLIAEGAAPRLLVLAGIVATVALVVAAVFLDFLILDFLTVQEFHNAMIHI